MEKLGKKLKHDHTLTSILKFAIFSLVMLAPIFSVASRCLYVICNKNAKDSYNGNIVRYQQLKSDNLDNVDFNLTYEINLLNNGNATYNSCSKLITFNNNDFLNDFKRIPQTSDELDLLITSVKFSLGYGVGKWFDASITFFDVNNNITGVFKETIYKSYINSTLSVIITNIETINIYNQNVLPYGNFIKIIPIYDNALDNSFEYSLSQLEENSYYNWATNLGIYTPIYNMVHGLGGHDIIALLLAYWSIYTAIYIVFDIVIACFVKITHLLQSE